MTIQIGYILKLYDAQIVLLRICDAALWIVWFNIILKYSVRQVLKLQAVDKLLDILYVYW